jgi:hypothetical protein
MIGGLIGKSPDIVAEFGLDPRVGRTSKRLAWLLPRFVGGHGGFNWGCTGKTCRPRNRNENSLRASLSTLVPGGGHGGFCCGCVGNLEAPRGTERTTAGLWDGGDTHVWGCTGNGGLARACGLRTRLRCGHHCGTHDTTGAWPGVPYTNGCMPAKNVGPTAFGPRNLGKNCPGTTIPGCTFVPYTNGGIPGKNVGPTAFGPSDLGKNWGGGGGATGNV